MSMDNSNISFHCPKCHIYESVEIDDIIKLNSKWIKSFDNKAPAVFNLRDFYEVFDIYKGLLKKKLNILTKISIISRVLELIILNQKIFIMKPFLIF